MCFYGGNSYDERLENRKAMSDLPLFERCEPSPKDMPNDVAHVWRSVTSKMSEEQLKPFAGPIGWAVRQAIAELGGATCEQVEEYLSMKHQTVSGRIPRLVEGGYLMDSGERRENKTGRMAIVWKACNIGKQDASPRQTRYADGARDALLSLKEWIIQWNTLKGGWWLRDDGKDIVARIEQNIKGEEQNVTITHTESTGCTSN